MNGDSEVYTIPNRDTVLQFLIHDLNVSSSACEWDKIVSELAKTNTVYTIDLLGCGRSQKPRPYLYELPVCTNDHWIFIHHVIGEKTDVIATGESGTFVLMACTIHNTVIDKIMLVNPGDLVSLAKIPTKRTKLMRHIINTAYLDSYL